jgi:hypothetical protein
MNSFGVKSPRALCGQNSSGRSDQFEAPNAELGQGITARGINAKFVQPYFILNMLDPDHPKSRLFRFALRDSLGKMPGLFVKNEYAGILFQVFFYILKPGDSRCEIVKSFDHDHEIQTLHWKERIVDFAEDGRPGFLYAIDHPIFSEAR